MDGNSNFGWNFGWNFLIKWIEWNRMARSYWKFSMADADANNASQQTGPGASTQQIQPDAVAQARIVHQNTLIHRTAMLTNMRKAIKWTEAEEFQQKSAHQIRARLERIESVFSSIDQANRMAMSTAASTEEREGFQPEFDTFEDEYLDAVARMSQRLEELTMQQQANQTPANGAQAAAPVFNLQMQPQTLRNTWGKFDGKALDWLDFKDRFSMAVHEENMEARYKFAHLKASLTGEALALLNGWGLKEEEYAQAWDGLIKKYEVNYPLGRVYLNYFYALPDLKKLGHTPAAADLQKMINTSNEVRRRLLTLKYPVDAWDFVFVHSLHARLDQTNANKWEEFRKEENYPTLDRMIEFLQKQAAALQSTGLVNESLQLPTRKDSSINRPKSSASTASSGAGASSKWCVYCKKSDHKLVECPIFKNMCYAERKEVVEGKNLCPNCLKTGHDVTSCWDHHRCQLPACEGDNAHNSLYCPRKVPEWQLSFTAQQSQHSPHAPDPRSNRWTGGRGRGALKRSGDQQQSS